MMISPRTTALLTALLLAGAPAAFGISYEVNLTELNHSGVSGHATFTLGTDTLLVNVTASGLEANEHHPMHIHGFVGGGTAPVTPAADLDHDGYVEEAESEFVAGPGLVSIVTSSQATPAEESNPMLYPMADATGHLNFSQTYTFDLTDPSQALAFHELQHLDQRSFEIHGMTVPDGPGAGTPLEVMGIGGYKDTLPVAGGVITLVDDGGGSGQPPPVIPEPSSFALVGLAAAGLLMRMRTHT